MMPKPLRVGIISANWGVYAHLPAWRSLEGVEVTAICTSRPETAEAAAREHGLSRAFHDFREMAADPDIDVIDCGTRPPLREQMVEAALAQKKHVYNGIPFATSLPAARRMGARREAAGTVAAVDAFMQTVPALVRMKEMIAEGFLGEVHGFRVAIDIPLFTAALVNAPGYVWFANPANGTSAMRNNGSHVLHLLVWLFGSVEAIIADQSLRLAQWPMEGGVIEPRVPDTAFALIRFASGLVGQMSSMWSMVDGSGFRLEAWGRDGRLVATAPIFPQSFDTKLFASAPGQLGQRTEREVELPVRLKSIPGSSADADAPCIGQFPMAAIFASMRAAIHGEGHASPDFDQALHVQEIIEAAHVSSLEARWVRPADL
jgi:predicted dehydrogenase